MAFVLLIGPTAHRMMLSLHAYLFVCKGVTPSVAKKLSEALGYANPDDLLVSM